MNENGEYRCKICGGMLAEDEESFGFSKCLNCGNKFRMSEQEIQRIQALRKPIEQTSLFVSMTNSDVEKEQKKRKIENAIFAIKGVIALICLFIVAIFISIMTLNFQGKLSLENLEIGIIALIGLGVPVFMSIFAKVYKEKQESLIINILMGLLFIAIFVVISYFAFIRYFIGFI